MAYKAIDKAVPFYGTGASGYWLKGYSSGTTTPLNMGTDNTGGTTLAKCKINPSGYPISDSADNDTVFIPNFNADFKLALYSSETDADNNTTANAEWVVDLIEYVDDEASSTTATLDVAGIKMAFFMSAPPTGWAQDTTHNNKMMRVVSGTGGGSGGTDSPISYSQDLSHPHGTSAVGLTVAQMPSHYHDSLHGYGATRPSEWTAAGTATTGGLFGGGTADDPWAASRTQTQGSGDAHTHGDTSTTTLTATWSPAYVDFIIGTKS